MRIFVTGTRGIPDIPGGVEKHCQELYPLITSLGHSVDVATRTPYVKRRQTRWKNIQLHHIYAPRIKSLEAIVHTFLAVVAARRLRVDLVHIHAVGPGLIVPLARLLGLKVIVTNHGPDYDRQKWGKPAKTMLRLGEWLGGRFANEIIVISSVIQNIIWEKCKRKSTIIYNGVPMPVHSKKTEFIDSLGLPPGKYIIAVARFVPEKGLDVLVRAFQEIQTDCRLVIAGDADHETEYSQMLKRMIDENPNIIRTGYITGEPLNQLFSHAALFVLPSYHEGLPIALLEAMSYGLSVVASDIPANLEVELPSHRFFKCGDIKDLKEKLVINLKQGISKEEKGQFCQLIQAKYNWNKIAKQTVEVYHNALE